MPSKTINELPEKLELEAGDNVVATDNSGAPTTKKVTGSNLAKGLVTIIAGSSALLAILAAALIPYLPATSDVTVCAVGCKYTTDGTADNIEIQSALNYVHLKNGGSVFIKSGTYDILNNLTIYDNTELKGETGTILKRAYSNVSGSMIKNELYSGGIIGNFNIKIHDITWDDSIEGMTFNQFLHAISFFGTDNVSIYNNTFKNLNGDGIYLSSGSNFSPGMLPARNTRIFGNFFDGSNVNRQAISLIDTSSTSIFGNVFNRMATTTMPSAIDLEPNTSTQRIINTTITGNTFYGNRIGIQSYNLFFANVTGLAISGNVFDHSVLNDIFIYQTNLVSITGNTHYGSGRRAYEIGGSSTVTISGNQIFYTVSSGMYLYNNGDGITITGNGVFSPAGHGIWFENTNNAVVTGNTIRNWGTASTTYNAVYGEVSSTRVNVVGNTFTDSIGGHTCVESVDTSSGWQSIGNMFVGCSTDTNMIP